MAHEANTATVMTAAEVAAFLDREFPQMHHGGRVDVLEVRPGGAVVGLRADERHVRPGGTLSGPAMMGLADYAMYVALLGQLGPVALAVTTSLSINFLRKPEPGEIVADCSIIKLGRRLAVGEVDLKSEATSDLVAHAVVTYAIPQEQEV